MKKNRQKISPETREVFEEARLQEGSKEFFGLWVYILSDSLLFASLFATYAVLSGNFFGGPTAVEVYNLPMALLSTLLLLTSSFTSGLATVALHRKNKTYTLVWLIVTVALGIVFVSLEISEFYELIHEGFAPWNSGAASGFFGLVATHGLHVTVGSIWMITSIVLLAKRGITKHMTSNLLRLSLFWHFLDIIWIFIFTIVYLIPFI